MMGHVWENLQEDSLHLPRTKRLQISRPDSSSFAQEESHNSETGFLPGAVAAPLGVALGLPPVGVSLRGFFGGFSPVGSGRSADPPEPVPRPGVSRNGGAVMDRGRGGTTAWATCDA